MQRAGRRWQVIPGAVPQLRRRQYRRNPRFNLQETVVELTLFLPPLTPSISTSLVEFPAPETRHARVRLVASDFGGAARLTRSRAIAVGLKELVGKSGAVGGLAGICVCYYLLFLGLRLLLLGFLVLFSHARIP